MRIILYLFILWNINFSYCQVIPTDSLILKTIYGKLDKGNKSYTRPFKEGEDEFSYKDGITYSVVFKTKIKIENQNLLLIIIEAPNSNQHGHTLGYRDLYYLRQDKNKLIIVNSIISENEIPLGDENEFKIIDIGKNKNALISTFQSSGNHHFERTKDLYYLTLSEINFLITLEEEYDNLAWKLTEDINEECEATNHKISYEIIPSDKEWFDIKIQRTDNGYTKGCKDLYMISQSNIFYYYNGQEYVEKK